MSDDYRIPSREEHNKQTRKLWINCIVIGCVIFVLIGGLMAYLFLTGHDTKKVVEVSTVTFQVLAVSYMACLFIPVLLVSLMRVTLGIEMSRKGLEIGNRTTGVLEKLDGAVEEKLERGDRIFDRIERFLDAAEKGDHPIVKTFEREMESLRSEIRAKKDETDADLNAALDEGEREAENLTEKA